MPGGLSAGSLQRWYEALCRFHVRDLRSLANAGGSQLRPRTLREVGAVYAFWWTGDTGMLWGANRRIVLKGAGGRPVTLDWTDEWLGLHAGEPIPLYVGKTGNLNKRVRQHTLLGRARVATPDATGRKAKAPTTSCQLRAGLDHLFPAVEDTRDLLLDNVGLSFVELSGDEHGATRFYLEDYAVGAMRPPFNVDVER